MTLGTFPDPEFLIEILNAFSTEEYEFFVEEGKFIIYAKNILFILNGEQFSGENTGIKKFNISGTHLKNIFQLLELTEIKYELRENGLYLENESFNKIFHIKTTIPFMRGNVISDNFFKIQNEYITNKFILYREEIEFLSRRLSKSKADIVYEIKNNRLTIKREILGDTESIEISSADFLKYSDIQFKTYSEIYKYFDHFLKFINSVIISFLPGIVRYQVEFKNQKKCYLEIQMGEKSL